jgi:hypothetical protein
VTLARPWPLRGAQRSTPSWLLRFNERHYTSGRARAIRVRNMLSYPRPQTPPGRPLLPLPATSERMSWRQRSMDRVRLRGRTGPHRPLVLRRLPGTDPSAQEQPVVAVDSSYKSSYTWCQYFSRWVRGRKGMRAPRTKLHRSRCELSQVFCKIPCQLRHSRRSM